MRTEECWEYIKYSEKKTVETLAFSVEKRDFIIKLQQNFKFDVFWNINKCDFTLSSPYTNSYNNQLKMFHTDMIMNSVNK